jgi:hypothetical protein
MFAAAALLSLAGGLSAAGALWQQGPREGWRPEDLLAVNTTELRLQLRARTLSMFQVSWPPLLGLLGRRGGDAQQGTRAVRPVAAAWL